MSSKNIFGNVLSKFIPKRYKTLILAVTNILLGLSIWFMTDSVDFANQLCNFGWDWACTWSSTQFFAMIITINGVLQFIVRLLTTGPVMESYSPIKK